MTDKTMREKIAKGNPFDKYEEAEYGRMPGLLLSDEHKAWKRGAAFVLRIQEIKEGQELREKAEIGYLDVAEFYRDDDYQHTQACKSGDHVECSGWTGEGPKCRCDCHPLASGESR